MWLIIGDFKYIYIAEIKFEKKVIRFRFYAKNKFWKMRVKW